MKKEDKGAVIEQIFDNLNQSIVNFILRVSLK